MWTLGKSKNRCNILPAEIVTVMYRKAKVTFFSQLRTMRPRSSGVVVLVQHLSNFTMRWCIIVVSNWKHLLIDRARQELRQKVYLVWKRILTTKVFFFYTSCGLHGIFNGFWDTPGCQFFLSFWVFCRSYISLAIRDLSLNWSNFCSRNNQNDSTEWRKLSEENLIEKIPSLCKWIFRLKEEQIEPRYKSPNTLDIHFDY